MLCVIKSQILVTPNSSQQYILHQCLSSLAEAFGEKIRCGDLLHTKVQMKQE